LKVFGRTKRISTTNFFNDTSSLMTHPRISIITPSFNQGHFIEKTIQSVLNQNYSNLEYIIIDGNSTDNTVDVIKKYEDKLSYWVSENDRGQADAINKGLQKVTGDIIGYLNSDDIYLPGALNKVAEVYIRNSTAGIFHGTCEFIEHDGTHKSYHTGIIKKYNQIIDLWNYWWNKKQFVQPEVFWTKKVFEEVGFFNADLHYVMDVDYWIRALKAGFTIETIKEPLAAFRFHGNQKSGHAIKSGNELQKTLGKYIFEDNQHVSYKDLVRIKGNWYFDNFFLQGISKRTSPVSRYLFAGFSILSHPQLLQSSRFKKHVREVLSL
jgi:glycosyltransferase involved in cell wall biosynthesis